jgi:hypothetical protein
VQEAFALTEEEAKAAPDASYVTQLKGGGHSYSVYVYRCKREVQRRVVSG